MKKVISLIGVVLLAGALTSCTATEKKDTNELMSTDTFVQILFSGDNLSGVTESPGEGETVHWNPTDTNYSGSGKYSAYFKTLNSEKTEICYEDSDSTGSVLVSTKANDYGSYFEISRDSCADFTPGPQLKWDLDGGGRFDLKVSSVDDKDETKPYVDALQKYVDERAATEVPEPAPSDPGQRPEPIPTTESRPDEGN